MSQPGELLSTTDAAAILGITGQQVRMIIRAGRLTPAGHVGRAIVLRRGDVERLAEERRLGLHRRPALPAPPPGLATVAQAAERLGVTEGRIHHLIGDGRLPRAGRQDQRVLVRRKDVERYRRQRDRRQGRRR